MNDVGDAQCEIHLLPASQMREKPSMDARRRLPFAGLPTLAAATV
jgi:hypothetical protein